MQVPTDPIPRPTPSPPSRALALLLLVALCAGGACTPRDTKEEPTPFATAPVERGELVETVSATGSLSPLVTVQVGSQLSGTIHRLHYDFNSLVKKGDLIAEIEPSLFAAAEAQAEADRKSAEAMRDKAKVMLADKKRQLERLLLLQADHVASESELDIAQFAHQAAEVELRVAEASLGQKRAALEHARVNLEQTRIYAPIDGVVISRNVDVGQTVAASMTAPTLFNIAQDLTQMQIETDVDEAFIGQIREGQPVQFTVFAYLDRDFEGRVAQVRLNPSVESGVVMYNCVIHVENTDLALKPGMTATVTIETDRHSDVYIVPNSALRFLPKPLPESAQALREKLERGQIILWSPQESGLEPIVARTGISGERFTEVSGDDIREEKEVAIPAAYDDSTRKKRLRFGLF